MTLCWCKSRVKCVLRLVKFLTFVDKVVICDVTYAHAKSKLTIVVVVGICGHTQTHIRMK